MNILEIFQELQKTSIPNLLALAGIILLLLAFVGEIGAIIKLPKDRQKIAGVLGSAFLVMGVGMYLIPASSASTASPEEIASRLLAKARKWEPMASADFSSDAWSSDPVDEESWKGTRTITSKGTYLVTMNYVGDGSSGGFWIIPILQQASDFYLTVDAKFIEGNDDNSYGLIFRSDGDEPPGYLFRVFQKARTYDVQVIDSDWRELSGETPSPYIAQGKFNRLAVIAEGSELYFYINDKFVHHVMDNQISRGSVGLRIGVDKGTELVVEFDNFEFRTPR